MIIFYLMILVANIFQRLSVIIFTKASPVTPASLCFFLLFLLSGCADKPSVLKLEGHTMGTTYHITAIASKQSRLTVESLQALVDARLKTINNVMSTYIADSELSRLNQMPAGSAAVISNELLDVLVLSERISVLTDGAFDVTVGPLVNLWGFGPEEIAEKLPSDQLINALKARVGYRYLEINRNERRVIKQRDLYIDLSSIAKGYGVDALGRLLENRGVADYMVEIGGEILLKGESPKQKPWLIGVEKPTLFQSGYSQAISGDSIGIATSGDYRNYREIDGSRFSHTIDPSTGRPITHNLASVTVVAETCAEADALATAIDVLGPVKGLAFVKANNIAAYFIVRNGDSFDVMESPAFKKYKVDL